MGKCIAGAKGEIAGRRELLKPGTVPNSSRISLLQYFGVSGTVG